MYTKRRNHRAIVNVNSMDLKSSYIIIRLGKLVHHLYVLQIASAEKIQNISSRFARTFRRALRTMKSFFQTCHDGAKHELHELIANCEQYVVGSDIIRSQVIWQR